MRYILALILSTYCLVGADLEYIDTTAGAGDSARTGGNKINRNLSNVLSGYIGITNPTVIGHISMTGNVTAATMTPTVVAGNPIFSGAPVITNHASMKHAHTNDAGGGLINRDPGHTIILAAGDSMTSYGGTPGPGSWVHRMQLHTNIVGRVQVINVAKSGDALSTQMAAWNTYFRRFMPLPGQEMVVLAWIGINDAIGSHTIETYSQLITNNLLLYWNAFRTNGCKVAAMTMFNGGYLTTSTDTTTSNAYVLKSNAVNVVNQWMRTNVALSTAYVDLFFDPDGYRWNPTDGFGGTWGAAYPQSTTGATADGLHPSATWSAKMATNIVAILASNGYPTTNIQRGLNVQGDSHFWPYTSEAGQPAAYFHGPVWMCETNILGWYDDTLYRTTIGLRPNYPDQLSMYTYGIDRTHLDAVGKFGVGTTPLYWIARSTRVLGQYTRPTTNWNYNYEATAYALDAGWPLTNSGVQPHWPTTVGATVDDGNVTWTCRAKTPHATFHVWGLGANTNLQLWTTWNGGNMGHVASNGYWYLGSNSQFFINYDKVGIGTYYPSNLFHVESTAVPMMVARSNTTVYPLETLQLKAIRIGSSALNNNWGPMLSFIGQTGAVAAAGMGAISVRSGAASVSSGDMHFGLDSSYTSKAVLSNAGNFWVSNLVNTKGLIIPQQAVWVTSNSFGTIAAGATNHLILNTNGCLWSFWCDGWSVYSKQLAP